MATIDIPLPAELTQALTPPVRLNLQLPKPEMPTLTLPIGGTLQGVADFTRGIPTDSSMNFSLMLQLAPIMASMECLLKILKFIGVVVGIVQNLSPANLVTSAGQIVSAAADLKDCLNLVLPTGPLCFVKDLLALIARMLLNTVQALESVLNILSGLQLQLADAQAAGNADLIAALQCAQQNANIAAEGTMQALQPVAALLTLTDPFLKITGTSLNVSIPGPVPAGDLQAMQTLLQTLGTVAQVIKDVADAIPC
jgi:hypothetical protein